MALVKYSALISSINGKIGGTIFKTVAGQMQVMQNRSPRNPKKNVTKNIPTVAYGSKTAVSVAAQAWRNLTDGKRTAWAAAAQSYTRKNRAGDPFKPSGYNYFVQVMSQTANASKAVPAIPTGPTTLTNLGGLTIVTTVATSTFTIATDEAIVGDEVILVRCSPPLSKGKQYTASTMRVIDAVTPAVVSPYDEWSAYEEQFGTPQINQRIWVSCQVVNTVTGQTLPPIVQSVDFT